MPTTKVIVSATAAAYLLLGCASYKPRPLNDAAHQSQWLARSPADQSLLDFAASLKVANPVAPTFDPADGITLPEAEVVALFYNPDLRMARLRLGVARASADHAGLWSDPELGFSSERILENVESPWVVGATIGLTLPISGRLAAEKSRANAAAHAELLRVAAQEWAVRSTLRKQWVEWSVARERVDVARTVLADTDQLSTIVARLEQAGELGRLDSRVFRMESASLRADLQSLEARVQELEIALRALMGLSTTAPLTLNPSLTYEHARALAAAEALDAITTGSPTLAILRAEYEVAERTLRREVRAQYPDLTLSPGFEQDQGEDRALLGLSLALPLWNRNQRGVAEAIAERDRAAGAYETQREQLTAELAQASIAADAAQARRATIETELVPMIQEQDQDARRVAALGQVNTLLLLDTITRQLQIKNQLLDARLAESIARIRVDELIGPPSVGEQP